MAHDPRPFDPYPPLQLHGSLIGVKPEDIPPELLEVFAKLLDDHETWRRREIRRQAKGTMYHEHVTEMRQHSEVLVLQLQDAEETIAYLRERIHEAVDECQRRYSKMESSFMKLRALFREAGRMHGDEMERQGKPRYAYISGYGQATAASILGERNEAQEKLADALNEIEMWKAAFGTEALRNHVKIMDVVLAAENWRTVFKEGAPSQDPDRHAAAHNRLIEAVDQLRSCDDSSNS